MKTTHFHKLLLLFGLLAINAQTVLSNNQANNQEIEKIALRPFVGVRIDPNPLPQLLAKHLKLEPDAGLLIDNIQKNSPAEKALLEKDDIIIAFQGITIISYEQFVDLIRSSKIGDVVNLTIIKKGEQKEVTLTLASYNPQTQWKYPSSQNSFRPGRAFRLDPDNNQWQKIPPQNVPHMDKYIQQFFNSEQYHEYMFDDGTTKFELTIEGNPNEPKTKITVNSENKTFETTIQDLDKLPEEYQEKVNLYIKSLQQQAQTKPYSPWSSQADLFKGFNHPFNGRDAFQNMIPKDLGLFDKDFNRFNEQFFKTPQSPPEQRKKSNQPNNRLQQLEQRLQEMEKQQQMMLKQLQKQIKEISSQQK